MTCQCFLEKNERIFPFSGTKQVFFIELHFIVSMLSQAFRPYGYSGKNVLNLNKSSEVEEAGDNFTVKSANAVCSIMALNLSIIICKPLPNPYQILSHCVIFGSCDWSVLFNLKYISFDYWLQISAAVNISLKISQKMFLAVTLSLKLLTHFRLMFHLQINEVVDFYLQNVWKIPVEEWHFK